MKNLTSGGLTIEIIVDGPKTVMRWLGQSDSRNPAGELNPYMNELLDDLKNLELTIDFTELEYMNSSTVPPILQFLKKLNDQEVKTTVAYKAELKWQAASFKALETFSRMFTHLTVMGI